MVASGEQSNEEAHAWAELVRAAGGGALVSSGFPGAGDWDALAPYAARIADLDHADLIVVSGEREVGDAAGVLELRVRQAVRRGARLLLAAAAAATSTTSPPAASPRARSRPRCATPSTRC